MLWKDLNDLTYTGVMRDIQGRAWTTGVRYQVILKALKFIKYWQYSDVTVGHLRKHNNGGKWFGFSRADFHNTIVVCKTNETRGNASNSFKVYSLQVPW